MKYRYLCLYLILAFTFALTSCKDKKKDVKTLEQDYVQQPQMILNSNDSNEVRDAVNYYLTALNHKQVDKALSMLFYYDLKTNKVRRLTDKENAEQKAVLSRFAGYRAEIEYIKFFRENDSEVKYNIYFSDKPSTPSNPNCMGFMIRPVRLEGRWYLTLAGENQATYSSQIDKQQ
jgi:hypothetical protein